MEKTDMIYGTRAVIEAIHAGKQIEKIMIQSGLVNDLIKELINIAKEKKAPYTFVPAEKLKRLSTKNHQGVICLLSSVSYASVEDLIDKAFSEGREPLFIILDRITDVRNFGAIARTAECAGVDGIIIGEKGSAPITSDAMKTSAGALNHLPVAREKDLKKTIRLLRDSGIKIVACTEKASKEIYHIDVSGPVALIMGSEEDGISDALLRDADDLAKIPMKGKIGSLNVSVAAGIIVYEVVRRRLK
ncbi:23S rRNA (guanosine(2251)-2'-O)-methyltransferase RlmB [Chryseosolibacter indicus]|uniref:23S rRNA (Guanosine(2251)-2'-O)-methyltransferase RlmB n=1 Tax=Chryseosolibacter indicus TaxID=2782351 RepID=A0ABS5VKK3_9BACT|nr:23S rRNA (guanosine(2251)-2'-O)-methyltransferase RlmB [Chryseosolibacter indicus]MBT1701972.1 23S rRNA (guanosine(2251)-2'-O)-methyltransferase RlmB [Chryseosolibacter indicus]